MRYVSPPTQLARCTIQPTDWCTNWPWTHFLPTVSNNCNIQCGDHGKFLSADLLVDEVYSVAVELHVFLSLTDLCCIPFISWTRDHEMVITSSRLAKGTHLNAYRQFRHHEVIVVYVYAECANENHTLSSIMASNMVKLPKYCWILLKYCKKIDLQPNIHLLHHEPPPSLITSGELEVHEPNSSSPLVITSSRLHEMNGTLFHRSSTCDHEFNGTQH